MQRRSLRATALMFLFACGTPPPPAAPPAPQAPSFAVLPAAEGLSGDTTQITLRGVAPGSTVELTAERPVTVHWPTPGHLLYRAEARFRAGADGALALADTAPLSGSYAGADLRGLFWSMTPTQDAVPDGWPDDRIRLVARQDGRTLATTALTLHAASAAVEVTPVDAALPGAFLARLPGAAKRPAVIVLGGSEGNDLSARDLAPRLASHGYAVLGLPYYAPQYPGLKRPELAALPAAFVDIPVDRLDQARAWLQHAPGVDSERIAIWGISKGAEFSLLAAAYLPWVTAVVSIVPSDVVWEGWGIRDLKAGTRSSFAWRGEPLPFVPYDNMDAEFAKATKGEAMHLREPMDRGRAMHPELVAKARIRVERFRGALLLAGGGDDQLWASGFMAENIARTRAAAGLATTALVYPDAGHMLAGDGWSPTPNAEAMTRFGGTPAGNARAQAAIWRETLAFLARTLHPPAAGAR